ncbi:BatD family protein [Roseibium aggregatum]|uniref:BatD family protein n=1 Tax=Roseibium aggregatum TaxID=187304 RepID=A0A939IZH0_9HYPH|nr:BatD family protein [Roseibium aggregatum]MBN9670031.1 BatD family protein [Roseibium aggregatum]
MRTIRRILLVVLSAVFPATALAQDPARPIVEVEFPETETIPGQALTLRLTILVPTWMPKPAVFPSMDVPNLRITLPERATSPTSKRVDGADWSGVTRRYLISPMVPGGFTIPEQTIEVIFARPDAPSEQEKAAVTFGPLTLQGLVPEGAEGLDPFIAASELTLTQELPENTEGLSPGDGLKRTVTAKVTGSSPIILPPLMAPPKIEGFAAYAEEPLVEEHQNRGVLSGTRRETVTLMAQGNGRGELPAIEINWYNLDSKEVETASLDAVPISATGAPASPTDLLTPERRRSTVMALVALMALLLAGYLAGPTLQSAYRVRRARYLSSKAFARKSLLKAVRSKDYPGAASALRTWLDRPPETHPKDRVFVEETFRLLSASRFGQDTQPENPDQWQALEQAIRHSRARKPQTDQALPALNP